MKISFFHTVALIGLLLFSTGCSNFQKLLKSNKVDEKYTAAISYYEKEDYYRANQLLEQVLPLITGSEQSEKAKFIFADTYFKQGDYLLSAFHFKSFYETYPRSPLAEEAMFLYAKSNYNSSPGYEQDQTTTLAAIEALQEYLLRYPTSARTEEANKLVEDLFKKLDRKAFDNAKLYYNIRYYRSAVVAFQNFLKENPASPYSEEAAYLRVDAQYMFAQESVPGKQQERYDQVIDFYQAFVDQYPDSKFKRNAEQVYEKALAELTKIKAANQQNS